MADRPFISIELDRRIAVAKRARDAGQMDARAANRALMPWAAAEAWLVGHQGDAISPRDGQTPAGELCPLDATIGELTRARDTLARQIDEERKQDRMPRYIGLRDAVRRLERLRDLRIAFRLPPPMPPTTVAVHERDVPPPPPAIDMRLPPLPTAQPSLLADLFGPDGKPLPIERNVA